MIFSLVISLVLTLVIELAVTLIMGVRDKDDIAVIICANVCTNPVVVYISNCLILLNNDFIYNIGVAILEILAVFVEFIIYKKFLKFNKVKPFVISLICNIISFSIGLVVNSIM